MYHIMTLELCLAWSNHARLSGTMHTERIKSVASLPERGGMRQRIYLNSCSW